MTPSLLVGLNVGALDTPDAGDVVIHPKVLDDSGEDHAGAASAAGTVNEGIAALWWMRMKLYSLFALWFFDKCS